MIIRRYLQSDASGTLAVFRSAVRETASLAARAIFERNGVRLTNFGMRLELAD